MMTIKYIITSKTTIHPQVNENFYNSNPQNSNTTGQFD